MKKLILTTCSLALAACMICSAQELPDTSSGETLKPAADGNAYLDYMLGHEAEIAGK